MFYVNDFPTPSVWMAAYFVVSKNLYGIGAVIVILGCIYGVNGVVKRILNYPFFEPLGRLTYGAFLVHFSVMRLMFFSVRAPVHYSDLLAVMQTGRRANEVMLIVTVDHFALTAFSGVWRNGFVPPDGIGALSAH